MGTALKVIPLLATVLSLLAGLAGADTVDPFTLMAALRPAKPAPAPDVVFRTLDGRQARLAELRGKPVLLGFFTTW